MKKSCEKSLKELARKINQKNLLEAEKRKYSRLLDGSLYPNMGENDYYKRVKEIYWINEIFDTSKESTYPRINKYLKKLSLDKGYEYKKIKVHDHKKKVSAYHIAIFEMFKSMLADNRAILTSIRR